MTSARADVLEDDRELAEAIHAWVATRARPWWLCARRWQRCPRPGHGGDWLCLYCHLRIAGARP